MNRFLEVVFTTLLVIGAGATAFGAGDLGIWLVGAAVLVGIVRVLAGALDSGSGA